MKKYYYRLLVSYKGTFYHGWQIQKNSDSRQPTIQGELHRALAILCQVELFSIKSIGSGRTDAKVHALGQVVRIEISKALPCRALTMGLNALLNKDVRILEAVESTSNFHPVYDALWKEYNYVFSFKKDPSSFPSSLPFYSDLIGFCPYHLDIELIKKACEVFQGVHDFCNFYCVGTKTSSTLREIYLCQLIEEQSGPDFLSHRHPSPYYTLKFVGNGFLKQMVRLIVGTLWSVGRKKILRSDIEEALNKKQNKKLGIVAPAEGLYLKQVNYTVPFRDVISNGLN